jgi:hypothetical protein
MTNHSTNKEILGWQIDDQRRDALTGIADAAERLRRLADDVAAATKLYPKPEEVSKALQYTQNQMTWSFANLLAAIHDASAKAYEADTLAATLAGVQPADAPEASR